MPTPIHHLCRRADWERGLRDGVYAGAPADRADGFLHFSTSRQVRDSAARHRAGVPDLVMLTVAAEALGDDLRWEPSRGGAVFPHLYATLPVALVRRVDALPLDADGRHRFPDDLVPGEAR